MITAGISFTGNLVFLLFSSGEEQSWNKEDTGDEWDDPGQPYEGRDHRKKVQNVQVIPVGMDIMDLTLFYEYVIH